MRARAWSVDASTSRWTVAAVGAFEWREWGGEAVVFVHASGDTHALSAEATALVAAMRAEPWAERSAAQWLDAAGFEATSTVNKDAEELMGRLETIGLVRRPP